MKYLLDTNTVSYALRNEHGVGDRLLATDPTQVAISVLTEAELWYGVGKLGSPKLRRAVAAFLAAMPVLPLTSEAAREYGALRLLLERRGKPIGVVDTFIAAHARVQGLTLVTSNARHFARVAGLTLEDWRSK